MSPTLYELNKGCVFIIQSSQLKLHDKKYLVCQRQRQTGWGDVRSDDFGQVGGQFTTQNKTSFL